MIIGGVILCGYGAKVIFYAFSAIVFLISTGIVFGGVYNFVLPPSTGTAILVVVLVVACVIGGFAAFYMKKFFEKFGVPILAAGGGIIVGLELIGLATSNGLAAIGAMVLGAIVGFYVGKKLNKLARCVTTALIGAFLTVRGIKCYTVGLGDETVNG